MYRLSRFAPFVRAPRGSTTPRGPEGYRLVVIDDRLWRAAGGKELVDLAAALAHYTNKRGEAWVSAKRLAQDLGVCVRTVYYRLAKAVKAGLIVRVPRFRQGLQVTSLTLVVPKALATIKGLLTWAQALRAKRSRSEGIDQPFGMQSATCRTPVREKMLHTTRGSRSKSVSLSPDERWWEANHRLVLGILGG